MAGRKIAEKSDIAGLFQVASMYRIPPKKGGACRAWMSVLSLISRVFRRSRPLRRVRNSCEVAPDRGLERRLGTRCDVAAPPGAVDAIERQRLERTGDALNRYRIQRNVVRKTKHEAQRTAIHRHHGDISGQQRASPFRPDAPMHDCGPGKMPAGADETNVIGELMAITRPWHDRRMRPRHPLPIVAMQIDRRATKSFAPVGDRAIIMRM